MQTDGFQQGGQFFLHKNGVGTIPAGELPHPEMRGQVQCSVPGEGIGF